VPRIKRFHPIAHDFNRDPEVRELRRQFGDWMALVWMEMCSISDRNEGIIKGDITSIAESLAHVSLSVKPHWAASKVLAAVQLMASWGWIEVQLDRVLVCNYAEYHPRREQASSLLPSLLPSEHPKDKEKTITKEVPPSLNGWPPEWEQLKQRILSLPFFAKNPDHIGWIADLDWWKTQDEKFSRVPALLDELLVAAVAYIETEGYKPRTKAALRKKLFNCMEFEAKKAERREREERQRQR